MEDLEMMKPKHGFHILAWIHTMMKKHFPELMKKVTPSLPTLKVFQIRYIQLDQTMLIFTNVIFQHVLYGKYAVHEHDYFDTDHESFFDELTKIKIVEYVLNTTIFVEEEEEGRLSTLQRNKKKSFRDNCFGINKLINLQVFDDAYPVHDGDLEDEGNKFAKDYNFEKINIKVVRGVSCTASGECSRISTNSSLWMPSKITMVCKGRVH